MEYFNHTPERELSAQEKLAAHLKGIKSLHQEKDGDIQELIVGFVRELKTKFTERELMGSEAYHMLTGSGSNPELMNIPILNPDPAFKDIEKFIKEKLSNI